MPTYMQYPPNNIRLVTQNILEYIVVLFIILECRSVYTYMSIDLINDVLFRGTLFLLVQFRLEKKVTY